MPCIEKADSRGDLQTVATSIDACVEQPDSENLGTCGEVMRQQKDDIGEKGTWEVLPVAWYTSQFEFKQQ